MEATWREYSPESKRCQGQIRYVESELPVARFHAPVDEHPGRAHEGDHKRHDEEDREDEGH